MEKIKSRSIIKHHISSADPALYGDIRAAVRMCFLRTPSCHHITYITERQGLRKPRWQLKTSHLPTASRWHAFAVFKYLISARVNIPCYFLPAPSNGLTFQRWYEECSQPLIGLNLTSSFYPLKLKSVWKSMLALFRLIYTLDDGKSEEEEEEEQQRALVLMPWIKCWTFVCMDLVISWGSLCYSTPPAAPLSCNASNSHCVIIFLLPEGVTLGSTSLVGPRGAGLSSPLLLFSKSQKWWEGAKGRVSILKPLRPVFTDEPAFKRQPAQSCSRGVRGHHQSGEEEHDNNGGWRKVLGSLSKVLTVWSAVWAELAPRCRPQHHVEPFGAKPVLKGEHVVAHSGGLSSDCGTPCLKFIDHRQKGSCSGKKFPPKILNITSRNKGYSLWIQFLSSIIINN